jgi:hypothetical protein
LRNSSDKDIFINTDESVIRHVRNTLSLMDSTES